MAQQKNATVAQGSINKNLDNRDNSIFIEYDITATNNHHIFSQKFNEESKMLLAKGGQSNVYAFVVNHNNHNNKNKKLYIAKYYDLSKHKNTLQTVWREYMFIKQTKLLNYDGIYYDEREETVIITSEPLNYTLRHYVDEKCKNRNVTEYECKLVILDIMDKLWTIHKYGFIHNDLTPDNIMLNDVHCGGGGGWKIIDYGLMFNINHCRNKKYGYKGTRGWTPPEINIDSQCNTYSYTKDIWSLGLIILYILFKNQPFTLSHYEQTVLCQNDRDKYKQYFYYNKLLQLPYKNNKFKKFVLNKFNKFIVSPKTEKKENSLDFKTGEMFLKKYLKNLYSSNKISYDLCNLLSNYILTFDPTKRLNCSQIYKHKWFNDVRHL